MHNDEVWMHLKVLYWSIVGGEVAERSKALYI